MKVKMKHNKKRNSHINKPIYALFTGCLAKTINSRSGSHYYYLLVLATGY